MKKFVAVAMTTIMFGVAAVPAAEAAQMRGARGVAGHGYGGGHAMRGGYGGGRSYAMRGGYRGYGHRGYGYGHGYGRGWGGGNAGGAIAAGIIGGIAAGLLGAAAYQGD